jgi:molybdopterin biosynthesis enzyme
MKLHTIKVESAVGKVLCHDITKIVRGECKEAIFRKGHIIKPADIPEFLKIGRENIYIMDLDIDDIHEDIAGIRLGTALAGPDVMWRGPVESKVSLYARQDGLLKINIAALEAINEIPDVILSTLPNNTVVRKGEMLAGTKVIPLIVPERTVAAAEKICREAGKIIQVKPFRSHKVGIIITGNEVYKQRVSDSFGPVIKEKLNFYEQEILRIEYAPDICEDISEKIKMMVNHGAGLVFVTGGMSVDPDDVTPNAIISSGAEIIRYGAPVLPGAMFMLAYLNDIPIMGIPACGMFCKTTIVDLLLPRLLIGERLHKKDIIALGHGGLCRTCGNCHFPNCTFGNGIN